MKTLKSTFRKKCKETFLVKSLSVKLIISGLIEKTSQKLVEIYQKYQRKLNGGRKCKACNLAEAVNMGDRRKFSRG